MLTAAAAIAAVAAVAAVASSPSSRSTLFVVLALQLAVVALLLPWGEEAVDLIGHCVDAVEDGGPGRDPRAMDALYQGLYWPDEQLRVLEAKQEEDEEKL